MRGFGSTEIESGMTCLQLGHVADSPTRSPSVDNRCAAASQSERHRAWRVVPQHAITFVFSNAKSSRQQTHTSSGATVNTLAGDGRVKPPSSASSSSSSDPSISQVVGVASGGGGGSGAAGAPRGPPRTTSRGRSASHAWQTVVPGAFTCVEINQCVGARQFFTQSFLGDDAAVLALSSGEEPASPRHRAGVASMAWRTTR